jgi:hypothetical protein
MNNSANTINAIKILFSILSCLFGGILVITAQFVSTDRLFTLNSLKLFFDPTLLYFVVNFLFSVIIVVALSQKRVNLLIYIVELVALLLLLDIVPIVTQIINIFKQEDIQVPFTIVIFMFHVYLLYLLYLLIKLRQKKEEGQKIKRVRT